MDIPPYGIIFENELLASPPFITLWYKAPENITVPASKGNPAKCRCSLSF